MNPIRMAVVGASSRSAMMFYAARNSPGLLNIVGMHDIYPERVDVFRDSFGRDDLRTYISLEQLVADPAVDAVFVATGDNYHVAPVVVALQAGKHVYCEKPMAITVADCETIIETARTSESIFYLGMNLRHIPTHETVHNLITSGALGRVLTIEANEHYFGGRTYFRRWNRLRNESGGLWVTKACHDFDILNWLAGARARRVFATSRLSFYTAKPEAGTHCRACAIRDECPDAYDVQQPESALRDSLQKVDEKHTGQWRDLCLFNSDKDTFDHGMAVVDYENGIQATYTCNMVTGRSTRQLVVAGTQATAQADTDTGLVKVWPRYGGAAYSYDLSEQMKTDHGGADERIIRDFVRCCQTGEKPRSSWNDGLAGLTVSLAARQSCDTGRVVHITESVEDASGKII